MSIGDHTESRTSGNEEANARLIGAAPELLAASKKMSSMRHTPSTDEELNAACDAVDAAIAKAEGRA